MTLTILQKHLAHKSRKKVLLKINDNRSTMVSVRWDPKYTKVSLHRMFLNAPKNIMQDLACYVRREQDAISPVVKAFIEDRLKLYDYSHEVDQDKLYTKGDVYNLQKIYEKLNREYFSDRLKLYITWFGRSICRNKSRLTFGLYHDPLKLIKINKLLDSPIIPEYLVSYVIYHEMVHHVCPSYYDENGVHRVHSKEFKEKEMQFKHYDLAVKWIQDHTEYLFH